MRFQVRSDLSIRGEKDISYDSFETFINSLRSEQELSLPQNVAEGGARPDKKPETEEEKSKEEFVNK